VAPQEWWPVKRLAADNADRLQATGGDVWCPRSAREGVIDGVDQMELTDNHRRYWRKNLNITATLLAIWFVVTFVVSFFARDLSFNFFGWPFSFWMGAQGSLVVYCLIIGYYAWYMNKLDIEHGVEETEE
jgi:putative solute:sodium symporter small subunit